MVDNILLEIEKINKKRKESLGDVWRLDRRDHDLREFLDFILDYFKIEQALKDEHDFNYIYEFLGQKTKYFNYIEYLLDTIKPFLLLSLKLSQKSAINERFEKTELKEDSIVSMIYNFVNLKRTGRKRRFSEYTQKEFKSFKDKFSNIIHYYKKTESFDGVSTGSILDYARAVKEFNLSKEQLSSFLFEFKRFWFVSRSSRATKYRFDKDIFLIEKSKYTIKDTLEKFDFYDKCLNDYIEKIEN